MLPSPRSTMESLDSTRAKLRESLATALAMVPLQQKKPTDMNYSLHSEAANAPLSANMDHRLNEPKPPEMAILPQDQKEPTDVDNNVHIEATTAPSLINVEPQLTEPQSMDATVIPQQQKEPIDLDKILHTQGASAPMLINVDSHNAEPQTTVLNHRFDDSYKLSEHLASNKIVSDNDMDKSLNFTYDNIINRIGGDMLKPTITHLEEFTPKHASQEGSIISMINDENLEAFGHNVESVVEIERAEENSGPACKKPRLDRTETTSTRNGREPHLEPAHVLAIKIEEELFKLFGGVNKKYKEKGRSLLFNLKDRNNPELRERVTSGEIAPERLCSMSAEELASEELSQWRIAKAEELAHMVVLQDSDVDIRRLVKKNHKGEFQVEMERDDSVSVEVGLGESLISDRSTSKAKETEGDGENETERAEPKTSTDSKNKELVEEFNGKETVDQESLPAIVSLDEYMGSVDSKETVDVPTILEKKPPASGAEKITYNLGTQDADTGSEKTQNINVSYKRTDSLLKIRDVHHKSDIAAKRVQVWEGLLQLNISATITANAYFKSGEKTSAEDWPSFLEIKGRVRVDAFEKFLQELRLSRSRAIMVVLFCWKEGSSDSGVSDLREVVESYIADERVGFAEPAPGVELYFCPPHARTLEMLGRQVPKDYIEPLSNSTNEGLIGIVIWRKSLVTTTISPKHSHKHGNLLKKHDVSKRPDKDNTSTKSHLSQQHVTSITINYINPSHQLPDEPIDDIPPGFGPPRGLPRNEDDLPEFNFVGGPKTVGSQFPTPNSNHGSSKMDHMHKPMQPISPRVSNSQTQPFASEHVRELIHKYGQTKGPTSSPSLPPNIKIQAWNDEDDIPEWKPPSGVVVDSRPLVTPPNLAVPPPQIGIHSIPHPPPQMSVLRPHFVQQMPQHFPPQLVVHPPQLGQVPLQPPLQPHWQVSQGVDPAGVGFRGPHEMRIPDKTMMQQQMHFGGSPHGQQARDWRLNVSRSQGA
ncbi:uncharacterized protein LOC18434265 [Amborella trichopoda]|uniref:uncharacterized protein LOC18434265 n=1 Tax=Amborella trichopoda TaxID=13333 RepID=UPI0005D31CF7|nr:uncharacterized protein LOC18434265 [Amborella trichopoda]|eukprot:XP_011623380.1 uncharacterized protein LOC18434265 [Amborella trichopoda]